ncbi:MAG: alpha/beta hydrolase [Pseudomonadota bacterium]
MSAPIQPPPYRPDPATKALLERMEASNAPSYATFSPKEARAAMVKAGEVADMAPPEVASVFDRTVPTRSSNSKIRVYEPNADAAKLGPRPCALFFHGGGFVIGDLDSHDNIARSIAVGADCMVVAVDYRLAPEHRYPAAVEDAVDVYSWLKVNAGEFNVDPDRLAVSGDSAGATLAAILTHVAKERGETIRAQALFYPLLDMAGGYPSHAEFRDMPPISEDVLAYFWRHYLGDDAEAIATRPDVTLSPIVADDFSGLAPAYIMTAGLDPLRDEGAAYAAKLSNAGVDTVYSCVTGTIHGCLRMGKFIPAAFDALDAASAFLKRRL